jgi:release factor glutamine methyltransferase
LTIRDSVLDAASRLAAAGIEEARRETWLLLGEVMGLDRATLLAHGDDPLSDIDQSALLGLVERRCQREPMAQILGRKEFWSLPFRVSKDVLCPRPDSEALIDMALTLLDKARGESRRRSPRILDLGTGSGCLVLAMLHELPSASGVGVDRSQKALTVARANSERLRLSSRIDWLCADWGTALEASFDLIISNPPYIEIDAWPTLAPEIRLFEPDAALTAGKDGLDAYRRLAPDMARLLAPKGIACLEHGLGQADAVEALMSKAGLTCIDRRRDLPGIERCLAVMRQG